jgi:hypothetical protein
MKEMKCLYRIAQGMACEHLLGCTVGYYAFVTQT